jgi:hypothetical protein
LYGSFKQIDKTYKELQEERNTSYKAAPPEPEPEPEPEYEPEPPPKPAPEMKSKWEMRRTPKPAHKTEPEPETEVEVEPETEYLPEPPPRAKVEAAPPPVTPPTQPRAEPAPRPEIEPMPRVNEESVIHLGPAPGAAPPPAPAETAQPVKAMEPEPLPQPVRQEIQKPRALYVPPPPKPEPVQLPSLDSVKDGSEISLDILDALFQADKPTLSAHLKDKTLQLRGVVNKVFIRDHIDVRYLMLGGNRKLMWEVRCGFNKEAVPQMSRLKEGQPVIIQGKYDGYSKNIIFKDCVLVG